jgi:ribosome recycling factor
VRPPLVDTLLDVLQFNSATRCSRHDTRPCRSFLRHLIGCETVETSARSTSLPAWAASTEVPVAGRFRGYSKKAKGAGKSSRAGRAVDTKDASGPDGAPTDLPEFDVGEFCGMMRKSVEHFQHELANIRMGRATPGMLDHLHVNAYGEKLPMKAVGTVSVKSSQMLAVTCFDPNLAGAVASCIEESPLKLRAQVENDGQLLVPIPAPTHETIEAMLKLCKGEAEAAKVSIRNARKLANAATRSLQSKDATFAATQAIQKLTDGFIEEVDEILKQKSKDIAN